MVDDDIGRDLAHLVDFPEERLEAEYKAQLDLGDVVQRAKLARHIAALANHGGGYIVTGFSDDMIPLNPLPPTVSRDAIASVVKTYLEPAFQCAVRTVVSSAGGVHQVIVVPSHEAAPICTKANGPDVGKKIVGIRKGTYYTRKPGPESAPIETASEWQKVIRRCTSYDRTAILAAIEQALNGQKSSRDMTDERAAALATWHDIMAADFVQAVAAHGAPADLASNYFQFSYLIDPSTEGPSLEELMRLLQAAERDVDLAVRSGWPLFIYYDGPGGAHYRTSPHVEDGALEFVEINTIRDGSRVHATDVWRATATGLATTIRGYLEDSWNGERAGFQPGVSLSPNWIVRNLTELLTHASAIARSYPNSTRIFFRCEWVGLKGRIASDPQRRWHMVGQPAKEDRRIQTQINSIGEIASDPLAVVLSLAGPVLRALGVSNDTGRNWLESEAASWPKR